MSNDRKVRCECGWEGTENEVVLNCTFHGTREEPPEYEGFCPCCGNPADDSLEDVPFCRTCEDEYVKDEGDQCEECRQAALEDAYDARKDDALTAMGEHYV